MASLGFLSSPLLHRPQPIYSTSHTQRHGSTGRELHNSSPPSVILQAREWEPAEEEERKDQLLPSGLKSESMPKHITIQMDGNRRWARKNGWPSSVGHAAGYRTLRKVAGLCSAWGVSVLSVQAFTYENWKRSEKEVGFLLRLCESKTNLWLEKCEILMRDNIRITFLRDSSKLPMSLNKSIDNIEKATESNTGLHVIIIFSYGGKYDIMQACQDIAHKVKDGLIQPEEISTDLIEQELGTNCTKYPEPDLLIRPGGELRLSNYLLWQLAYTEFFFTPTLWPDFGEADIIEALHSYQGRERRYGEEHRGNNDCRA